MRNPSKFKASRRSHCIPEKPSSQLQTNVSLEVSGSPPLPSSSPASSRTTTQVPPFSQGFLWHGPWPLARDTQHDRATTSVTVPSSLVRDVTCGFAMATLGAKQMQLPSAHPCRTALMYRRSRPMAVCASLAVSHAAAGEGAETSLRFRGKVMTTGGPRTCIKQPEPAAKWRG